MTQRFINNYSTTAAQTFGAADTYLRVTSSAGLPTLGPGEHLLLTVFRKVGQDESGHEVVRVTAITADLLTVERSVEGAPASMFLAGDPVEARLTAGALHAKVDKEPGKVLSANNYTDDEKAKLSDLVVLISGETIKTVNDQSILGSGNILIQGAKPSLQGDPAPYVTQSKTYVITNYNSFSDYVVQTSAGAASLSSDTVTFIAPAVAGAVNLTLTVDDAPTAFAITVQAAGVATPTNASPAAGASNIGATPALTSSAFATFGMTDTQAAARWTVYQGGVQVHSSGWTAGSLTSYAVPAGVVAVSMAYTWTVEHRGASLGDSLPSAATQFSASASFCGSIGTPGAQGFGAGECPDAGWLTALGLSLMASTGDKAHANYGNYQHSNGGISVFVPKFYCRWGDAADPAFATYGANTLSIKGIETFSGEAAANVAGYALHRAFVNNGVEVPGFFTDKYLASKDGAGSCKSVANADPISLTTSAAYNPSSAMTGCTGILADAVVLARARGAGWNGELIFMRDAVAKTTLAHAQHATGTAHCAWYDPAGITNFPKGCNNSALADTNDATVTYAASTVSPKPKTRATANFAKTTHNGQECGIADVNGSMYQALLGLTMAGTSATDTAANGAGNAYVLKRATRHASLTGGFGGATDAWGTTASLAANYDLINGFFPWGATAGWDYFGNGANQAFSGATSGTDYLRSCCGIAALTGMSAVGTSQFGNDGNYRSGPANLFPMASGNWGGAGDAGVFCRLWYFSRSSAYVSIGFRAAAYGN